VKSTEYLICIVKENNNQIFIVFPILLRELCTVFKLLLNVLYVTYNTLELNSNITVKLNSTGKNYPIELKITSNVTSILF